MSLEICAETFASSVISNLHLSYSVVLSSRTKMKLKQTNNNQYDLFAHLTKVATTKICTQKYGR